VRPTSSVAHASGLRPTLPGTIAQGDRLGQRGDDPVAQASLVLRGDALQRHPKARWDPRR